ncbi:hypothetical protein L204_100104 [Cryptococcus depauperatus]
MPTCSVCNLSITADQIVFEHHVNSHFESSDRLQESVYETAWHETRESGGYGTSQGKVVLNSHPIDAFEACPFCDFPLSFLTVVEYKAHLDCCRPSSSTASQGVRGENVEFDYPCLIDVQQRKQDDETIGQEWDGPVRPSSWSDWVGRKVERGDKWWDPIHGPVITSQIPRNFSPGIIPILAAALQTSVHQRITSKAILCQPTVHIKSVWSFDLGWGCGYRNALMLISTLLSVPEYQPIFAKDNNGAEPSVRRIQGWIEEAWAQGYDPDGREQLGGNILGRKKWIGPSDLYAMFTYKGIPCRIFDFPKAPKHGKGRPAYTRLQQWVRSYFNDAAPVTEQGQEQLTCDVMMRSGDNDLSRSGDVRVFNKFPLILQHSGHSRTIVGYEENVKGDVSILVYDPGRKIPKNIRAAALSKLANDRVKLSSPLPIMSWPPVNVSTVSMKSARSRQKSPLRPNLENTHQVVPFSRPYTNGKAEIIYVNSESRKNLRHICGGSQQEGDIKNGKRSAQLNDNYPSKTSIPSLREDEEMSPSGWIRKKRSHFKAIAKSDKPFPDPIMPAQAFKTLNYFRISSLSLSKYTQYQILVFTGGPVLSEQERVSRKILRSTTIQD